MAGQFSLADAKGSRWPVLMAAGSQFGPAGVALNRPACIVGAPGRAHLRLKSTQVSKAHALIVHESAGVYVRDLCSTNKTFVNGRPIREARLKDQDILRFGSCVYRCHSGFKKPAQTNAAPPAELHVTDDTSSTQITALEGDTFLIGRRDGCDLVIHGEGIAAAHAVIYSRNGRRHLLDLTTGTGIYVNGTPVREAELQPGDDIQIGDFRIGYHLAEQAIAEETPEIEEQLAVEESLLQETPIVAEAELEQEQLVEETMPIEDEALAAEEELGIEETPAEVQVSASHDEPVAEPFDPLPAPVMTHSPARGQITIATPATIAAELTSVTAPSGIEYPTGEQEPAYLRGEPLFLKCATPFPALAEAANEKLELRIEGDILTGAIKRPPVNLFPRANKRPTGITSGEELLAQSFIIHR